MEDETWVIVMGFRIVHVWSARTRTHFEAGDGVGIEEGHAVKEAVRLVGQRAGGPEVRGHIAHHPAARGDTVLPIEVEPEDARRGRGRGLLPPLLHLLHPGLLCVLRWWSVWRVKPA